MADRSPSHWLTVCRHRVRGFAAPYLLILQHHIVDSPTRIVAPVVPAAGSRPTLLAPEILVGKSAFRAIMLNMTSVPLALIGETMQGSKIEADAVSGALDAIFGGYPVGLPLA